LPLALCALLAGGCASRPVTQLPELSNWDVRQQVLAARDEWEFSGRIAVSTGEDGFNGKLRWAQDHEVFSATVSGPLGIGTVRIEGAGQQAILTDKDGIRTELQDVEEELLYRYGWTIPVQSLRYWALGIPDPQAHAQTELNVDDQLSRLEQDGWVLSITSYRASSSQSLPHRLSATKSSTRVRIVIDKWNFFD
jgi:outer membrane lipoprotein LolB